MSDDDHEPREGALPVDDPESLARKVVCFPAVARSERRAVRRISLADLTRVAALVVQHEVD